MVCQIRHGSWAVEERENVDMLVPHPVDNRSSFPMVDNESDPCSRHNRASMQTVGDTVECSRVEQACRVKLVAGERTTGSCDW